jgi:hypothetical protein
VNTKMTTPTPAPYSRCAIRDAWVEDRRFTPRMDELARAAQRERWSDAVRRA